MTKPPRENFRRSAPRLPTAVVINIPPHPANLDGVAVAIMAAVDQIAVTLPDHEHRIELYRRIGKHCIGTVEALDIAQ